MPGFVVTRGLGPGATPSNLIARGFFPSSAVEDVVRGARIFGRRAKDQMVDLLEDLKVSVALVAINGKDLLKPIINTVRTSYLDKPTPRIEVTPTKLAVKKPDIIVEAKNIRNKDGNNRLND